MPDLPMAMMTVIGAFAPLYSRGVFAFVKQLLVGAILVPSQRTMTAVLRLMGKSAEAHFQNYYRVVNRAQWSSLETSRRLLGLRLDAFMPESLVIIGIDETIERRRGERISGKGIYHDSVRSVLGLYSIVTLAAAYLIGDQPAPVRTTAWYPKSQATFSDSIASVRRSLWRADHFSISGAPLEVVKILRFLLERFTETLCYAA